MKLVNWLKVPENRALGILWVLIAGWVGAAIYTLGADFWIPSLWPVVFAIFVHRKIIKTRKARLEWEAKNLTANIDQRPASDPGSW